MQRTRAFFSGSFCNGKGIEIGALHHPFPLPPNAQVRYMDRLGIEDLRKQYPELNNEVLVPVDIIDDGETLKSLSDGQEDFIIASQFLEHCENPIRALINMLRVVKDKGIVLLTIPDMRVTFDSKRPLTSNTHLIEECYFGTEKTKHDHFLEFTKLVVGIDDPFEAEKYAIELQARNYSIHFHVWDPDSFVKFLFFTKESFHLPFEIYATFMNAEELIVVLKKCVPKALPNDSALTASAPALPLEPAWQPLP